MSIQPCYQSTLQLTGVRSEYFQKILDRQTIKTCDVSIQQVGSKMRTHAIPIADLYTRGCRHLAFLLAMYILCSSFDCSTHVLTSIVLNDRWHQHRVKGTLVVTRTSIITCSCLASCICGKYLESAAVAASATELRLL